MTELNSSTLIVCATLAEARHLPTGTRLLITGMGKVRAAMALTRVLAAPDQAPIAEVINVGTAGALRDGHVGLFTPSVVIEHDISSEAIRSMGYSITDRWDLPDGDGTVLASGDTFVADPRRRDELGAHADLVDMEGCAFAHVCAEFDVPLRMVKVVSDNADESALDWPTLVDAAARRIGEWVTERGQPRLRDRVDG